MSRDNGIPKQDAFLIVCRQVKEVIDCAERLCGQIAAAAGWFLDDCRDDKNPELSDVNVAYLFDFGDVIPAFARLAYVLRNPLFPALQLDALELVSDALKDIGNCLPRFGKWWGADDSLAEAQDFLLIGIQELQEFCDVQAVAAFGQWGAHWFWVAAEHGPKDAVFGPQAESNVEIDAVVTALRKPGGEAEDTGEWEEAIRARNKWIYEQVMAGVKYPVIIERLKAKPTKWQRIGTIQGIRSAARTYAIRNNLPKPPRRRRGRPTE